MSQVVEEESREKKHEEKGKKRRFRNPKLLKPSMKEPQTAFSFGNGSMAEREHSERKRR